MVSSLPNEIILDILELAATASPASALTLCLLSSTTARSIRPILYRKVRLVLSPKSQVPSPVVLRPDPAAHRALQLLTRARSGSCTPAGAPRSTRPRDEVRANLEELTCAADWLLDRLYQNQGRRSRGALAGFRHLKCLRLFDADALSISQIISAPITHLHLVEPFKGGMKAFLSDVAPSLHSLAFLCLESLTHTDHHLGLLPKSTSHRFSAYIFPSSTSIAIKLDVSACSPPRER